ncbi:hypothetical protein Q0F98_06960 [Paenibacillus amylolyticus]|nr:hypothetical protein Q0F98_06960 [Paenibacillus amylolyticus]
MSKGAALPWLLPEIRKLAEQTTAQSEDINRIVMQTIDHVEQNNRSVQAIEGLRNSIRAALARPRRHSILSPRI